MSVEADQELASEVFQRVTGDFAMVVGKEFSDIDTQSERADSRPAGGGCIHVSFKFGFQMNGVSSQGCFVVPLPVAITLAGHLMLQSDETVAELRAKTTLDLDTKDAILELSNFAANAVEAAFKNVGQNDVEVRSAGCQGVRADVRPAFEYEEGSELLVGRGKTKLEDIEQPFEMLLMVPAALVPVPEPA